MNHVKKKKENQCNKVVEEEDEEGVIYTTPQAEPNLTLKQ